jgi:hypothetical protein
MKERKCLLFRSVASFAERARKFSLSDELISACCGMQPAEVRDALAGRAEMPLRMRAYIS